MLVVDASVAVKWLLIEEGRPAAMALLAGSQPLVAPDLVLAEAANVLWKVARRGADPAAMRDGLRRLPALFDRLLPLRGLEAAALELALAHGHPAYDCFYLALARREGAPLVTADARLAARFAGAAEIRLLGA